jgi:hypothetical protein
VSARYHRAGSTSSSLESGIREFAAALDQALHERAFVTPLALPQPQRSKRFTLRTQTAAAAAAWVLCAAAPDAWAQDSTATAPAAPPSPAVSPVPAAQVESAPVAPPPAAPVVVVQKTDTDKDATRQLEDGGLGLEWVYLNADVGAAYTNLVSLRSSNWQLVDNTATGPAFGFGAGVRLVFFSAGVRVRDLEMSAFNMWETDLEAALHFRIWRIDGAIGARGGYVFLGQFSSDAIAAASSMNASTVTVHGWNVGPTVDLDFYLSKLVSIGVDANAEFLFLERPPIPLPAGDTANSAYASLYQDSGSSAGVGFLAMSHLGVHF